MCFLSYFSWFVSFSEVRLDEERSQLERSYKETEVVGKTLQRETKKVRKGSCEVCSA